jgi:hypothetical protein
MMDMSNQIGGIYTAQDFSIPYGSRNTILPSLAYINNCRGYSHERRRESCFFVVYNEPTFIREFIVNDSLILLYNDHPITLPVNHLPDAICSDGEAIYVLCLTDFVGGGAISKFSINPWSSTAVWTRTLPYNVNSSGLGNNKIIVANANNVAFLYKDTLDVAPPIGLLAKDNSLLTNGYGNISPSPSLTPGLGLCSDGIYLHYVIESAGGDILGGAAISDITTSPYASFTMAGSCGDCATDGMNVVTAERVARAVHIQYSYIAVRQIGAFNFPDAELLNDSYSKIVFDGMRFWFLWEFSGSSYKNYFVIPLNLNRWSGDETIISITEPRIMMAAPQPASDPSGVSRMCFADNALWIIPKVNDTSKPSVRLPHLTMRY